METERETEGIVDGGKVLDEPKLSASIYNCEAIENELHSSKMNQTRWSWHLWSYLSEEGCKRTLS